MAETKKEIAWQAPEFIHYPKNFAWFIILGAVAIVLIGYFLWQKDFLTALLFILMSGAIFFFAKSKPKDLAITLDGSGIKINSTRISYSQIKNFWIVYEPPEVKTLNFETRAYLNRFLTVQLGDQDPLEIREFLTQHLPEDLDHEEPVSDKLSRTLKF